MDIRFGYTILYVKDVRKSLAFYKSAFGLQEKFAADDGTYAELETGSTTLSLAATSLATSNLSGGFTESSAKNKPFAIEIGFVTKDVESTVSTAVKNGATLTEKPKTKPWGQVVAYVRDPDGFLIEICSPMG
jgi:lactoylglutathione lyase